MRSLLALALFGVALLGQAREAAAQPAKPAPLPPTGSVVTPPPPGRGYCTEAAPCTGALGERFYYTPSGDKRFFTHR